MAYYAFREAAYKYMLKFTYNQLKSRISLIIKCQIIQEYNLYDILDTILSPLLFATIDILQTSSNGRISSINSGHSIRHNPSDL